MTKPLAVVVLISGTGRNLQAIIEATHKKALIDIKAVISNKTEAYGLKRAEAANIPTLVVPHTDYVTREAFEAALIQAIDSFQPEWIVLAGFMRRLGEKFVDHYPRRILNIHPSLLPKYSGLDTHRRALEAREAEHGASIHLVDHGLDSGPLIAQASLSIKASDNEESLQTRVMELETKLYPWVLSLLAESRLKITQNEILFDNKPLSATGLRLSPGKLLS